VADPPRKPRRDLGRSVRLGLEQSPLTDLYYHLMRAPWWQLVVLLVVFYMLANLAFACLYMMDLDGISSAHRGSFVDAFAFSVQTISTIGYGSLTPNSAYVHGLVTAEAMIASSIRFGSTPSISMSWNSHTACSSPVRAVDVCWRHSPTAVSPS